MHRGTNHNYLRPLIGVFINKRKLCSRKMVLFSRKLNQANERAKCSIFFFSLENINWQTQTVKGYVLEGSGKRWLEHRLPFPDIIYDRGAGFSGEEKAAAEELRNRFKKMSEIQFINSCKLKKWEVHQKLSKHKAVKKYLPVTAFSHGIDDIKAMISKYNCLFLKRSGGSGGKGVFALVKRKHGFCFRYYSKGVHWKQNVSTLKGLRSEMKTAGLKPDRVIIQRGINLIKYKNRPMDLRVLMVKDKNGIWNAVYNQARVAPKGAVITNASLGGEVMNYSNLYPALIKRYTGTPSDKQIRGICMTIARYMEKEFGPFGEMGIDIGVDSNGKVWLLEANSKPSKLPEEGIEDTVGISPQFLMILQYARLLYSRKKPSPNT